MVARRPPALTPIRLYLSVVIGVSGVLLALSLLGLLTGYVETGDLSWLAGSVLLIAAATARPVELRPHVRLSLRIAPQLMAAVLLGPEKAMLAAGIGVMLGYLYHVVYARRNDLIDLLFNAAQAILTTGAASIAYRLFASVHLGALGDPVALLVAAESMHLGNVFLLAGALSFSGQEAGLGQTFLRVLRNDPLQYVALLVMGILGALLARDAYFWAVPLLVVPLALVELTLVRQRQEAERERKLAVMEEVNQLKNDFIAAVTHDLRTPLMVIKGFGELLAEREDEFMDDERRAVECINLNSERLSELIEMLLQMSELDAGMVVLRREPTDATELIDRVIERVRLHAEQKGVTVAMFSTGPVPSLELDAARFEQVIANLLNNAIKFTPADGEVAVIVGFRDETLAVTVSDSGPGIPPDVLPRVFDRFYRARHVEGDRKSTGGLGLAIAKSIVELHSGTLRVESVVGEGSSFTVRIPRRALSQDERDGADSGDRALADTLSPARPLPSAR